MTIFNVPQDTELEGIPFKGTKLHAISPFRYNNRLSYPVHCEDINTWMKNINNHEDYALHRACSSYQPSKDVIMSIIEEKGLRAFKTENSIGITPSQYLKENPYTDVTEQDIIKSYLMKMLGEHIDIE